MQCKPLQKCVLTEIGLAQLLSITFPPDDVLHRVGSPWWSLEYTVTGNHRDCVIGGCQYTTYSVHM